MLHSGVERLTWLVAGVLFSCGFFGLMRPGEMTGVVRADVSLPSDRAAGDRLARALISIFDAKNRRFMGRLQIVIVDCDWATKWLAWLCADLPRDCALFPFMLPKLASMFKTIGHLLSTAYLTLGSIRTGGATYHFETYRDISKLLFAGRWNSDSTLKHYLQESLAMLVQGHLTTLTQTRIETVRTLWPWLKSPPRRPLRSLVSPVEWRRFTALGTARGSAILGLRDAADISRHDVLKQARAAGDHGGDGRRVGGPHVRRRHEDAGAPRRDPEDSSGRSVSPPQFRSGGAGFR